MNDKEKLVSLYQAMSDLTAPECAHNCRLPHTCCSPEYCDMAQAVAKEVWNEDISPLQQQPTGLRFMSPTGCVVPPHFRPLCTVHTCDISNLGFKMRPKFDEEWTNKYFALRNEIDELEYKLSKERDNDV